jgi:hypothetical protein
MKIFKTQIEKLFVSYNRFIENVSVYTSSCQLIYTTYNPQFYTFI